jgi:hypothetical protein
MIDPLELKARADEILDAMPPDGRPNGERTGEAIRIALGDLRAERYWSENGAGPDGPFALPINEFIADKRDAPEPLIGTEDDCILPAKGLGLLIAKGGKGKTTFAIELALHLASGVDYLGLPIRHPINILLIENEGPQEPFRRKLARKLENWPHEIRGHISIYTENWGHARLDLAEFVERLNTYCDANQIDLVIGDPLDSLGMDGEGSPSETRAMVDRFRDAGLFSKRAWLEPHHSRKDSVEDAVDAASGAWGGRPDAMLRLEKKVPQPGPTLVRQGPLAGPRTPALPARLRPGDGVVHLHQGGGGGRGTRLRGRGRGAAGREATENHLGDCGWNRGRQGQGRGGAANPPRPLRHAHRRGRQGRRTQPQREALHPSPRSGLDPESRESRQSFSGGGVMCGMAVWTLDSPYRESRDSSQSTRTPYEPDALCTNPESRPDEEGA